MKKKILGGIILGASIFSVVGCDSNVTKSDRYIEYEYMQIEDKIGLEKMNDDKIKKILDSLAYTDPAYKEYRASKVKGDLITEDIIKELVNRAKILADRYYKIPNNYVFMDKFNKVDSLGTHIKKDLALNLLKESIEFGTVEEITNKIKSNDESLYWYVYVGNLLKGYYRDTSDFSSEDKEIILEYLTTMRTYPKLVSDEKTENDLLQSVIKDKENRLIEQREVVKSLLQKKYFPDMN